MFKVTFDTNAAQLEADFRNVNLDVEKYVRQYINKVYQAIAKQHSRKWTYITPPGDKRKNIYLRTGKLRDDLSRSRYVTKTGQDQWEGGFNIRPGSYLSIHAGYRDDPPLVVHTLGSSSMFLGRMTIPLRAALNANGTPKSFTARTFNNLLILPFHVLQSGKFGNQKVPGHKPMNDRKMLNFFKRGTKVDFSGEDTKKFHENSLIVCKKSGRKFIPLYVLAKTIRIPKRIFIKEKMDDYYDDVYNKLQEAIEKALPR